MRKAPYRPRLAMRWGPVAIAACCWSDMHPCRTSKVEVDGIAVWFNKAGSREHCLWIVAAKLCK